MKMICPGKCGNRCVTIRHRGVHNKKLGCDCTCAMNGRPLACVPYRQHKKPVKSCKNCGERSNWFRGICPLTECPLHPSYVKPVLRWRPRARKEGGKK